MIPTEVDVDGRFDEKSGIMYIGKATRQEDGTWRCLANVGGALCLVEVSIKWDPKTMIGEARRVEG